MDRTHVVWKFLAHKSVIFFYRLSLCILFHSYVELGGLEGHIFQKDMSAQHEISANIIRYQNPWFSFQLWVPGVRPSVLPARAGSVGPSCRGCRGPLERYRVWRWLGNKSKPWFLSESASESASGQASSSLFEVHTSSRFVSFSTNICAQASPSE